MDEMNILSEIVKKSDNELILFVVALGLIMLVLMVQIYRMMLSGKRFDLERAAEERKDELEEKKLLISVITQVTDTVSEMKASSANTGVNMTLSLQRIHDRIDTVMDILNEVKSQIARIEWSFLERRQQMGKPYKLDHGLQPIEDWESIRKEDK